MKIVFLDIDGVLNHHVYLQTLLPAVRIYAAGEIEWSTMMDPECVARLQRILDATGAKIVVSSSWREAHKPEAIQSYLRARGAPTAEVIGSCPMGFDRGDSIVMWMATSGADVKSYVCLDDAGPTAMARVEPRTVRTSMDGGLTDAHAKRAIEMLGEDVMP